MKEIYISADVIHNSLDRTGHAIAAFTRRKPQHGVTVYHYRRADIRVTAASGAIYLLSEAEMMQPKISLRPSPADEIGKLARTLGGAV